MNADWLRRLRTGARLLFWSQLAAYLLPNVFGLLIPFVGWESSDLKWGSLIHTLASVPALIGVYALTSRCPRGGLGQPFSEALRLACGILATLALLQSIIWTVSRFAADGSHTPYFVDHFRVIGVLAVVVVLIRFGQLARSLGAARLGRSFFSLICVFVALVVADELVSGSSPDPQSRRAYMIWMLMWAILHAAVWVWGLVLIGRFRRKIGLVIAGNCGSCEYDLTGNVSGVCPECGTEIKPP